MQNKNIKLIISDWDGCLADCKNIHFLALNKALATINEKYVITREEHLSTYDGLPTNSKLEKLHIDKGFPLDLKETINRLKQKFTIELIKSDMVVDERLRNVLKQLKDENYKFYVASNSIRETLQLMLCKTGLIEYTDYFLSNNDIDYPKPHPQMYMQAMVHAGVKPSETLIIEDSIHGREAAIASGANLMPVDSPNDVTYENIKKYINKTSETTVNKKWEGSDINILIPMAGLGSRFSAENYVFPKPLIETINGKPMIQLVVENLNINANFIYIVRKEHYEKYNLKYLLNLITPNCKIVQVDKVTEGAACTTLLAKEYIDNDKPLIIANSDQYLEWDSNKFYYALMSDKPDGCILTFESIHPKWSFAKVDENGFVTEVAEKNPISNQATCGIYHWGKGSDYVKYAEQMINKNLRVNNEFYTCPVYNEAIADGKKIKTYKIDKFFGIGVPSDLDIFLKKYNN